MKEGKKIIATFQSSCRSRFISFYSVNCWHHDKEKLISSNHSPQLSGWSRSHDATCVWKKNILQNNRTNTSFCFLCFVDKTGGNSIILQNEICILNVSNYSDCTTFMQMKGYLKHPPSRLPSIHLPPSLPPVFLSFLYLVSLSLMFPAASSHHPLPV